MAASADENSTILGSAIQLRIQWVRRKESRLDHFKSVNPPTSL